MGPNLLITGTVPDTSAGAVMATALVMVLQTIYIQRAFQKMELMFLDDDFIRDAVIDGLTRKVSVKLAQVNNYDFYERQAPMDGAILIAPEPPVDDDPFAAKEQFRFLRLLTRFLTEETPVFILHARRDVTIDDFIGAMGARVRRSLRGSIPYSYPELIVSTPSVLQKLIPMFMLKQSAAA